MIVEEYPVGWAVDHRKAEPILAYLIDLPGIAMQGSTMQEAEAKLRAVAPVILQQYRAEGRSLPVPSSEPSMQVAAVELRPRRGALTPLEGVLLAPA